MDSNQSNYLNNQLIELDRILSTPEVSELLSNVLKSEKKFITTDLVQQLALQSAYKTGYTDLMTYVKTYVNQISQ